MSVWSTIWAGSERKACRLGLTPPYFPPLTLFFSSDITVSDNGTIHVLSCLLPWLPDLVRPTNQMLTQQIIQTQSYGFIKETDIVL